MRGRWWLPPSSSRAKSYESMYACVSFVHQKCSNHALTNLLFSFCRFMWIIDSLAVHSSSHPKTTSRPSTPKMLQVRECTIIPSSSINFIFEFAFEFFKECGGASTITCAWIFWLNFARPTLMQQLHHYMKN